MKSSGGSNVLSKSLAVGLLTSTGIVVSVFSRNIVSSVAEINGRTCSHGHISGMCVCYFSGLSLGLRRTYQRLTTLKQRKY